ncbi:carboxypeptidase-like regulatory domain-containing protein [Sphingobacterium sp. E70]|uniref:carboxypeptidase-like regulatory domain-containing protein n=1 Tax=Sphingobacterium sp. E70 TaxID=2853439 RepID=UPI00211CC192|nr:carboxypeptidase-like regulatory domain-containing protein [Sphingobacterium sp. E70]ULT26082.1 carboxypeptidase-like regulatory domain-containing protein [Sphingobacterium sp. E70]
MGAPAAAGTSTSTNANGEFRLVFPTSYVKIRASYVGYDNKDAFVTNDAVQSKEILMDAQDNMLEEVVVKAQKKKYSNKDNPAVALIRKVIENKEKIAYRDSNTPNSINTRRCLWD